MRTDPIDRGTGPAAAATLAASYVRLASRWLEAERDAWGPSADPVVRDAMDGIARDRVLIGVEPDRRSAGVSLSAIDRSAAAWRAIARATGADLPLMMADHLAQLRGELERAFPGVPPG
jgi:hypothetical protein